MPVLSKKKDHQKFVVGFALSGLLESGRGSMLPLETLSLGLRAIAVEPNFIAWHFFEVFKQNVIAYRSSKVQIAFLKFTSCDNRVYSNSCYSCSFEPEIIKLGQSSHKMYSNNTFKCLYKKSLETY